MSWDLYVGNWHTNYTHNTNPMIRAASIAPSPIPESPSIFAEVCLNAPVLGTCWKNFDGRPAREAGLFARDIIAELERDPGRYEAMNPENGWGSRLRLIEFMKEVASHCESEPDATFEAHG